MTQQPYYQRQTILLAKLFFGKMDGREPDVGCEKILVIAASEVFGSLIRDTKESWLPGTAAAGIILKTEHTCSKIPPNPWEFA